MKMLHEDISLASRKDYLVMRTGFANLPQHGGSACKSNRAAEEMRRFLPSLTMPLPLHKVYLLSGAGKSNNL
jgi:hypothetical protein